MGEGEGSTLLEFAKLGPFEEEPDPELESGRGPVCGRKDNKGELVRCCNVK